MRYGIPLLVLALATLIQRPTANSQTLISTSAWPEYMSSTHPSGCSRSLVGEGATQDPSVISSVHAAIDALLFGKFEPAEPGQFQMTHGSDTIPRPLSLSSISSASQRVAVVEQYRSGLGGAIGVLQAETSAKPSYLFPVAHLKSLVSDRNVSINSFKPQAGLSRLPNTVMGTTFTYQENSDLNSWISEDWFFDSDTHFPLSVITHRRSKPITGLCTAEYRRYFISPSAPESWRLTSTNASGQSITFIYSGSAQ